jgi:hypothetical protein
MLQPVSRILRAMGLALGAVGLAACSSLPNGAPQDDSVNGAAHARAMPPAPARPLRSRPFTGPKANTGTVMLVEEPAGTRLTLSDDFVIPDTPAPHWALVDSAGRMRLLERLKIQNDRTNRSILVPTDQTDIAEVRIWCAFAETVLGATAFDRTVVLAAGRPLRSTRFTGVKVDRGYATLTREGGRRFLTLSDDFVVPDTPAPHWQVRDDQGHAHLLQLLVIKDGKTHRRIEVPEAVQHVAKVEIWCSFAEVLLGEATFPKTAM